MVMDRGARLGGAIAQGGKNDLALAQGVAVVVGVVSWRTVGRLRMQFAITAAVGTSSFSADGFRNEIFILLP